METQNQTTQAKYEQIVARAEKTKIKAEKSLELASKLNSTYKRIMQPSDTHNRTLFNEESRMQSLCTPSNCYVPVPLADISKRLVEKRTLTKKAYELALEEERSRTFTELKTRQKMYEESIGRQDESIHMAELKRAVKDLGDCVEMIDEHYQMTPYFPKGEEFRSYLAHETDSEGLQDHLRYLNERESGMK